MQLRWSTMFLTFNTLSLLLLLLLHDALPEEMICGKSPTNPRSTSRVVGGVDALEGSWPWMASLQNDGGSHICGATLITRQWAITAAHCVGFFSTIVLGDYRLDIQSPSHEEHPVEIFVHPDYNPATNENDIALLRLQSNVTFSSRIQPACLSSPSRDLNTLTNCWVTGWGDVIEGGGGIPLPDVLQEAPVGIFTDSQCFDFGGSSYFPDVMICAGVEEGGIDTCQGDSGGPLICEVSDTWELVGITSFGEGCARPNRPGVYTRVPSYMDYVADLISKVYIDCSNSVGHYVKDEDECNYVATCFDGTDENDCPGLNATDFVDITSPSYPSNYPNNQDVLWLFKAANSSHQLRVHFLQFDLESFYDFLYVGSGPDASSGSSLLLTASGSSLPDDVTSVNDHMWLRFTTDGSVTKMGFLAQISIDGEAALGCSDERPCRGNNEVCEETVCVCISGYVKQGGICIDENECLHPDLNTCNSITEMCINSEGTFECRCKPEFFNGTSCGDGSGEGPVLIGCGTRPAYVGDGSRIVGGTDSQEGAWPWIASLRNGEHFCGASLINAEWAVTAAHCVGSFSTIIFGDLLLNIESSHHQEKSVTIFSHPSYNGISFDNDIALLRLSSAVDITDYVRPACLATSQDEINTYSRCTIAGWGATSEGGFSSNILQEAEVGLFPDEACINFYGSRFNPSTMICAGFIQGGIDTCQGDSGGPLVCIDNSGRWHLVGITSWGDGCARPYSPGVYTRVSKYMLFIQEIQNEDFPMCDDGNVIFPSQVCDYEINCADSSDELNCDLLEEGSVVEVTSPNYPNNYDNYHDIVWVIHAEEDAIIHVHFEAFYLETDYDYLSIGNGSEPSQDSLIYSFTGSNVSDDFFIHVHTIWLNFESDYSVVKSGFKVIISVINKTDLFVCGNGLVISNGSVCDFLGDCPNSEDEQNCPPIPEGRSFTVASPGFPFSDYPNSFTETYVFTTHPHLTIRLTFLAFDLEEGYDSLTVGYGQNPAEESSIMYNLTGNTIPEDIISPSMALWMMFSTDSSVAKTGFLVNVTATTPPEQEQCSEIIEVENSVQTLQREESTRGNDCGIALVSSNENRKVRIVVEHSEIDCIAGEFLVVRSTEAGHTHQRDTYCGAYSEFTINSEDGVALIEYHINMVGHGFRMTYQSVGRSSIFRGCNQLIPLNDGPVTFTSPRYPRNYRARQRCEYRIVASPGKRINLSFNDFVLERDANCRKDYVMITDLITNQSRRHCGVRRNLTYNSGSNYVSVMFRSGQNRQFRGFSAQATETN